MNELVSLQTGTASLSSLFSVCVQMCVTYVGMGVRGFSNLGIPGIEHKLSGLAAGAFIH